MDECAALEKRYTSGYRGFESHPLRQSNEARHSHVDRGIPFLMGTFTSSRMYTGRSGVAASVGSGSCDCHHNDVAPIHPLTRPVYSPYNLAGLSQRIFLLLASERGSFMKLSMEWGYLASPWG